MPISLVPDAPETDAADKLVRELHDPPEQVVVTMPSSGLTAALGKELLVGLGKRLDLPAGRTAGRHAMTMARAWLHGLRVQRLIVYRAHLMSLNALDALLDVSDRLAIEVSLVANLDLGDAALRMAVADMPRMKWRTFHSHVAAPRAVAQGPSVASPLHRAGPMSELTAQDLPERDFWAYPGALKTMSPSVSHYLDQVYLAAASDADSFFRSGVAPSEHDLALWLANQMQERPVAEQVTILRATQTAALVNGILLQVDLAMAVGQLSKMIRPARFEGEVARILMQYAFALVPAFAAATTSSGLDLEQALAVPAGALQFRKARWVLDHGAKRLQLPAEASTAFAAYRFWLDEIEWSDSDPLWVSPQRKPYTLGLMLRVLKGMTEATGAPFRGLHSRASKYWRLQTGINMRRLSA